MIASATMSPIPRPILYPVKAPTTVPQIPPAHAITVRNLGLSVTATRTGIKYFIIKI